MKKMMFALMLVPTAVFGEIIAPEAVRFSNEQVRPAADKLATTYYFCKKVVDYWFANNMGVLIPVNGGNVVDGAEQDGRHVVTGNDVTNLVNRCSELINDYEAISNAKLNTVLNVAVHAQD